MKRHLVDRLGIVLILGLGALLIAPVRYALLGLIKHERFYKRRPTSYWLKLLNDDEARYRQWAAHNLGELGAEPGVVTALIAALKDRDIEVHRMAVVTLGTLGPAAREAVPALNKTLPNADIEDREVVEEALAKIDPKPVPKAGVEPEP
jgi:HEAT repeats